MRPPRGSGSGRIIYSGSAHETKLLERGHAIVQADLLCDLAILQAKHGRSGEVHLPAACRRQGSDEKITEGWPGMRPATFPAADHVVALGDEVGSTREAEVRKGFTKSDHERLDVVVAAAWRMQRILQEHVGGG